MKACMPSQNVVYFLSLNRAGKDKNPYQIFYPYMGSILEDTLRVWVHRLWTCVEGIGLTWVWDASEIIKISVIGIFVLTCIWPA